MFRKIIGSILLLAVLGMMGMMLGCEPQRQHDIYRESETTNKVSEQETVE